MIIHVLHILSHPHYYGLFHAVSPSVEPGQPVYFAIEFQLQEVTCNATGVPPPTITFMRGDVLLDGMGNSTDSDDINARVSLQDQTQPVLNDERVYVVYRTLEIVSTIMSDSGLYSCEASFEVLNQTLTDSTLFDIFVQSKCRKLLCSLFHSCCSHIQLYQTLNCHQQM